MATDRIDSSRSGVLHGLTSLGNRAAAVTMRPVTGAVGLAAEAGIGLQRRAVDQLLDSGELERLLSGARLHTALQQLLESDGAKALIDTFFDSGLLDRFLERLLQSDVLWRMIDEIAASPAVTAAISQQGLGFADQVGGEVRSRSRRADEWLERAASQLVHRRRGTPPPLTDPSG